MQNLKVTYPFVFIGHGELSPDQIDKCEECYIWFKKPVKPEVRKLIMKTCPPPLAGFFHWADEFVHFGSADDIYDGNIMLAYCEEKYKGILEGTTDADPGFWGSKLNDDIFLNSLKAYAADLERWINEVNGIEPVAFFLGPNAASPVDEWNYWSKNSAAKLALPYISEYTIKHKELFETDHGEEETEIRTIKIKGINSWVAEMFPGHMKHIYGYVARQLLHYALRTERNIIFDADERAGLRAVINSIYRADGIYDGVETLTVSDSTIKHNASLIESLVNGLHPAEKYEEINKFDAYTQLAFYASNNRTAVMFANLPNAPDKLKSLLADLPEVRKPVAASLLVFLANNLVKIGPAYEKKYDFKETPLAAEIMELSFDYPEVTAEAFINAAAFCDHLKNYEKMLEVSLKGYEKFPENTSINANVLYSAQKLGRNDITQKYSKLSEELSFSDPMLLLNHIYELVTKGNIGKAREMVLGFMNKGGKLSPELLANMIYTYTLESEDNSDKEIYLEVLLNFVKGNGKNNIRFKTNPDLICNGTIVFNNLKRYEDSEILLKAFKDNDGKMTAGLYNQAMFSPVALKDMKKIEETLTDFLETYGKTPNIFKEHSYIFATVSNCYALKGDANKTIEFLKLAKKNRFDIDYIKDEADYDFLKGNTEFTNLFK